MSCAAMRISAIHRHRA